MSRDRPRFKIVRGGRSDPLRFCPEAKSQAGWSRYVPIWGGAILVGLAVGFWPSRQVVSKSGPDQPILWDENQAAREAPTDNSDQEWLFRAQTVQDNPATPGASGGASFGFCHTGGGINCVVDGDTIWLNGQNIRIADIDAPETHEPRCPQELTLGKQATQRLHTLVNSGTVALEGVGRDTDRFGRKLRLVLVNGSSVGQTLVGEGLARWYEGGRRSWC